MREALRLLALENERSTRLNRELQKALAEAKGERVEQLELEIAQLQQTVAARGQALFGDSSERRPRDVAPATQPQKQSGHGPRKQMLSIGERGSEWVGQFETANEIDMVDRRFVELVHERKKYRCKCRGCIQTAPAQLPLCSVGNPRERV